MNEKTCATCRFCDSGGNWGRDDDANAICRKSAPVMDHKQPQYLYPQHKGYWPVVCKGDWCGEHKAKDRILPPDSEPRKEMSLDIT